MTIEYLRDPDAYGSRGAVGRAERRGELTRIRPGAYVASARIPAAERERHLLKMRAAARVLATSLVFTHESAAALHGIPVLGPWPQTVRVGYDGPSGRTARAGIRWGRATWHEGDLIQSGGLVATSAHRTALDLARTGTLAQGVAALDHVIAGGIARDELVEWVRRHRPFHGVARVERALALAHGRSESPLESLSLARIAELGFAPPEQQHELAVDGHAYRLDFFWPEVEVAAEADGALKYVEPGDLWREKRREDAIRLHVRAFLRWSWSDAWHSAPLERILRSGGIPRV